MYEHILLDSTDGVATLTLNRPDKLNAYTVGMGEEIVEAFDQLRGDSDVRAVILTGAGRAFCAGVDLGHMKEQAASPNSSGPRLGEERLVREFPLTLLTYPKPVIAAINGHAVGVGITMLLACDFRMAANNAKISLPFTKMGILPGLGSSFLLPRLIGTANARDLILSGRTIAGEEAQRLGLVNSAEEPETLLDSARTLAGDLAERDPRTLQAAKMLLAGNDVAALEAAMTQEQQASVRLRERG